jgi:hypothetical protein
LSSSNCFASFALKARDTLFLDFRDSKALTLLNPGDSLHAIAETADSVIATVKGVEISTETSSAFEFSVKTDNLSSGSSNADQFQLPLEVAGTYSCAVMWGDGTWSTIVAGNQPDILHTYLAPGTYSVKVYGICQGFRFNNSGDKQKLLGITRWGSHLRFGNSGGYFYGCSNLVVSARGTPDLTGTTNLDDAFRDCANVSTIPALENWNVASVLTFRNTFNGTDLSGDLSNWNPAAATDMSGIFSGCDLNSYGTTTNYALTTAQLQTWLGEAVYTA